MCCVGLVNTVHEDVNQSAYAVIPVKLGQRLKKQKTEKLRFIRFLEFLRCRKKYKGEFRQFSF